MAHQLEFEYGGFHEAVIASPCQQGPFRWSFPPEYWAHEVAEHHRPDEGRLAPVGDAVLPPAAGLSGSQR